MTLASFSAVSTQAPLYSLSRTSHLQPMPTWKKFSFHLYQYKPTSVRGYRRVGNKQDTVEIVFVPLLAARLRQQAKEIGIYFRNASVKAITVHK